MKLTAIGIFCACLLGPAIAAAGSQTGTLTSVYVRASDGLTYFYMTGTRTGAPGCVGNTYWMIKDENSEAGKKQYALLMEALAAGRQIQVIGMNTCTRWVDGEDVNELRLDAN